MAQTVLAAFDGIGGDTQRQRVNAQWVVRFVVDFFEEALPPVVCRTSSLQTAEDPARHKAATINEAAEFVRRFPAG